jgi:Uma2 family endonuclease
MSSTAERAASTWADYIAADEASPRKLERLHGELFAMAGGSPAHAKIIANLQGMLYVALRGGPCRSTSSEQRVLLPNDDAAYPDASVWCGQADFRDGKTLVNPTVIVEVLSPSTAGWDRTGKLELYRAIPSVRHIVLVEHDFWHVALVSRREDGTWSYDGAGAGGSVHLDAIGVTLHVDDVYEGMDAVGGPARDHLPERDPRERR